MNVLNKLTGYDRLTEALDFEFDLSLAQFDEVKKIAQIPQEYETTYGSFLLEEQVARRIFICLDIHAKVESRIWYIEPFAHADA